MMRCPPPFHLVLPLEIPQHTHKQIDKQNKPKYSIGKRTFSFRCSTSTTPASATIVPNTVAPTHGIHCPGLKYNSFCHSSGVAPGLITSFELGITISSAATRPCAAP